MRPGEPVPPVAERPDVGGSSGAGAPASPRRASRARLAWLAGAVVVGVVSVAALLLLAGDPGGDEPVPDGDPGADGTAVVTVRFDDAGAIEALYVDPVRVPVGPVDVVFEDVRRFPDGDAILLLRRNEVEVRPGSAVRLVVEEATRIDAEVLLDTGRGLRVVDRAGFEIGRSAPSPTGAPVVTVELEARRWSIDAVDPGRAGADGSLGIPTGVVLLEAHAVDGAPHRLRISGLYEPAIDLQADGDRGAEPLELTPGHYELYCEVPGHRAAGMHLALTVGSPGPDDEGGAGNG